MFLSRTCLVFLCTICIQFAHGQQAEKKKLTIKRTDSTLKIDGEINEADWKTAPVADKFITLRPTPFQQENKENRTEIYFLYNDDGIYVGGYLHEKSKDSITHELTGRDGFGANDFVGVIFDTYNDKLNGFEYFVTPLGEQMDARQAPNFNGDSEDFGWNSVWESACKIHEDGWSFEMFIPYSAIRFGKNKIQDWGLNIVRRRQKSGEQLFWQGIDPTVNGFMTQEGMMLGLENIKPPLRLQFSPYFSTYQNHDALAKAGKSKNTTTFNGGMDIKYGLSPAFTLDMTLIPDFGQVQTDNLILNLTPFEQKFNDNRPFFTEGAELFNKGNLFYSRRIPTRLFNATKISGRTQKGLGIGFLNAIAKPGYEIVRDSATGDEIKIETSPLTNYNIIVLNQSLKNNSSVSLVNTNVWRNGAARDANVTSGMVDLFDKKNMWNVGGTISMSNIFENNKNSAGYSHSVYFGKVSGRLNFNVWQDLFDAKYDKTDLGYYTNNNTMDHGAWVGYNWIKPSKWFNQWRVNTNLFYSRLVTAIDLQKRPELMYQNASINFNTNGQLKNLWWVGANSTYGFKRNDFYEPRVYGKVFAEKARLYSNIWWESNYAKKVSWGGNFSYGTGNYFKRTLIGYGLFGKIRFSSKFSIDHQFNMEGTTNQAGYAAIQGNAVYFSRRDVIYTENVFTAKYNFTNRMGITLRTRHYWSKVNPKEFFELDNNGELQKPATPFTGNVKQNYNFVSFDMVYTWQFAQGSFINIVWKKIDENFYRNFEKNLFDNFGKTVRGDGYNNLTQFNSFSIKVIYFLDYLTVRNKAKRKNGKV
ncbi:MAG: DUF5916 domain-containing protein [Bacteroidota bacterium]